MESNIRTINIGKAPNNDIVLQEPTISRAHAQITVRADGSVVIRDLMSTNGTFVNGNKISVPTQLRPGDSVMLGTIPFDWQKATQAGGTRVAVGLPGVVPADAVETITVGRNKDNKIIIKDQRVSGNHCSIVRHRDGSVSLVDYSTNGTFVNGQRVPGEFRLTRGDRVLLSNAVPLNWERILYAKPEEPEKPVVIVPEPVGPIKPEPPQPQPVKPASKTWIWIVAAILLAAICGTGAWLFLGREKKMAPDEIYAKYDNSVVLIVQIGYYHVTFQGKPLSAYGDEMAFLDKISGFDDGLNVINDPLIWSGTGFYVGDKGQIMTNHHVVSTEGDESLKYQPDQIKMLIKEQLMNAYHMSYDAKYRLIADGLEVEYRTEWLGIVPNGRRFDASDINDYVKCQTLARSNNEHVDLALIQRYDERTPEDATVVNVTDFSKPENRRVGSKIFTIGFPAGIEIGATDAGLQANHQAGDITQERGAFEYGHNIKVTHGASGSPVFDEYGRFAGVIFAVFGNGSEGYNLAVKPEQAAKFYKENL